MENSIFSRTEMLLGKDKLKLLNNKSVAVIGLGGVGGIVAECLARSGVGKLVIVDGDNVDISNLNRQILYNYSDINKSKVCCATKRLSSINPDLKIIGYEEFLNGDNIDKIIKDVYYVVDAIDDINAKVEIAKYCIKNDIPFICSLGMGNRLDPTRVSIVRLDKTYNCPFAKKFRNIIKNEKIDLKKVTCVFSEEAPIVRHKTPSSMMMVPSSAGLVASSYVISKLIEGGK